MSLPVSSASTDSFGYLTMKLQIFPAGQDYFNRTGVFSLGFVLSNQTYKPSQDFEPYNFLADDYTHFGDTNGFSEYNCVGAGGYGKVYKGILDDGQIVAIKRSQVGSMQGSRDFKNEMELSAKHCQFLIVLILEARKNLNLSF